MRVDGTWRCGRTSASSRRTSRRRFLEESLLGVGAALVPARGLLTRRVPASTSGTLTLREKVAQLFVISFDGTTAGGDIVTLLHRYAFGGVILYANNCRTAGQVGTLISDLQSVSRFPLLVCTDQEGGRIVRIRNGAPSFPWEAVYGRNGSTSRVFADASTTARDLTTMGLTMNLAPVVDVLSNKKSPIGRRSYGSDPAENARLSVAAIRGYQQHGMAATAKHFVGLGHTSIDSHRALPTVTQTLSQLEARDLVPFRAAIAAGVSTVMVAHVALPAIDPVARPASLSPVIIENVLRTRLGFKGVVMTDSLIMGALPAGHEADAAERALAAGSDILLIAGQTHIPLAVFEDAVERVVSAVSSGRVPESRLDLALRRVLSLKQLYPSLVTAAP